MANYALTSWTTHGSIEVVVAAMEAKLETVDDTKDIYMTEIERQGNEFVGALLYAA